MIEFDEKELKQDLNDYFEYYSETFKDDIKDFFNKNTNLIDTGDFNTLYDKYNSIIGISSVLTEILLLSGIDPLEHLTKLPTRFVQDIPIKKLSIPSNIKKIERDAFRTTMDRRLPEVYYLGKLKDWEQIFKEDFWNVHLNKIVAFDGELDYNF